MIVLVGFNGLERSLFEKASEELQIANRINYFENTDELFSNRSASSTDQMPFDFPRVIVMNIDSPTCTDEMVTLKATHNWKKIPIIGYGFLESPSDVTTFYSKGGASCIRKPATYAELVETTRAAMGYWLSMSILPCDYLREA